MAAVASWMLRGRNARSYNKNRKENNEDFVKLDPEKDPHENAKVILVELTQSTTISEEKRLNYLNAFVKLILSVNEDRSKLKYTTREILFCLRILLFCDSTQVRSGTIRVIRHLISNEEDISHLNDLLIPHLIARSLDLILKSDVERSESLKLMRKVLLLSPSNFDASMARSLVSLANGGIEEKDRLLRACLAILCELGTLNSELFILTGGVSAITRNLSEIQPPKISEALCGVLLFLLDRPVTRYHAAVDLHCVAAPYCDFHYRQDWSDKNRDEREMSFKCSRLTLLSILRSWPGILHVCSPNDSSGLKAIVDVLYLEQLEVRKAILDLLYDLLGLSQPEWTDELSVALSAIDPSEPQASWRLNEGFVAAEGKSILPHLSRINPSITEMHLSLLLYCFLETGLLGALGEVIATSDTFISVRATVLLGELLRLIQLLLPPECSNITPALPNLLEYATYNKPQALHAITALQQLHKLLKRRPASYSFYLDFILQSGSFMKSTRTERKKKYKFGHARSKIAQLVLKDGNEEIKETGVLSNKDAYTWNWNLIKLILKMETDFSLDVSESSHRTFLKRLVEFFMPSNNRYSHMDLSTPKTSTGYTLVGIDLIMLLSQVEDTFTEKLLFELFTDISNHVTAITSSKSAHDCLFSPTHMLNTQCQTYFLFIGRFATTTNGLEILNSINLFQQLEYLATTTPHDCYVKLILSSLDYRESGPARNLLSSVLKCKNENSRLYSTQFLLVLLRAGLPKFNAWGIKLLAQQLNDNARMVRLTALNILHEAVEVQMALETLIKVNPELLHLGERGLLLLIKFLSVESGFNALNKNDFVSNEIKRWDDYFNYRYVSIIETEISDILTLHQRGDDGRYDKRMSSTKSTKERKDVFLPAHIYGQLTKHPAGYKMLLKYGSIESMIKCIENGFCETNDDIAKMKAALWALGHFGVSLDGFNLLNGRNIINFMVRLAENCVVYSIRATAFYVLCLLATTKFGADNLFKLGWVCTRHDRHDKWPIIEEENWPEKIEKQDELTADKPLNVEDSDRTSSDQVTAGDFYVADADSSTTDDDILLGGGDLLPYSMVLNQQKSLTLPYNQQTSSAHHKRSLSESKTFEIVRGPDVRNKITIELGQRHRDNSVTESTTSGVSSCESAAGKNVLNDRVQTLSPIPSSSSLTTVKAAGVKIRRHSESSRRVSVQSTPSDRPSPGSSSFGKLSHQDLVGYAKIRSLRRNFLNSGGEETAEFNLNCFSRVRSLDRQKNFLTNYYTPYDFLGNHLRDGLSLSSLSSVQKFSTKEPAEPKGQCYMGICLPLNLSNIFPDCSVTSRRLSYTDKNILQEDSLSESESETCPEYKKKKKKKFKHRHSSCFGCNSVLEKLPISCAAKNLRKETDDETKVEVLRQVQNLSNPILVRHAKQNLLHQKQKNPQIFLDVCLYSEVCRLLSLNSYRLGPRRLLQELFLEVSSTTGRQEVQAFLVNDRLGTGTMSMQESNRRENRDPKSTYVQMANDCRKAELFNAKSTYVVKSVTKGFAVESTVPEEPSGVRKLEARSPPLSCVKEETQSSTENLLECNSEAQETAKIKTDHVNNVEQTSLGIKTLDSIKFTYKENKFPIKNRDVVN